MDSSHTSYDMVFSLTTRFNFSDLMVPYFFFQVGKSSHVMLFVQSDTLHFHNSLSFPSRHVQQRRFHVPQMAQCVITARFHPFRLTPSLTFPILFFHLPLHHHFVSRFTGCKRSALVDYMGSYSSPARVTLGFRHYPLHPLHSRLSSSVKNKGISHSMSS